MSACYRPEMLAARNAKSAGRTRRTGPTRRGPSWPLSDADDARDALAAAAPRRHPARVRFKVPGRVPATPGLGRSRWPGRLRGAGSARPEAKPEKVTRTRRRRADSRGQLAAVYFRRSLNGRVEPFAAAECAASFTFRVESCRSDREGQGLGDRDRSQARAHAIASGDTARARRAKAAVIPSRWRQPWVPADPGWLARSRWWP